MTRGLPRPPAPPEEVSPPSILSIITKNPLVYLGMGLFDRGSDSVISGLSGCL